jgi:hypothetical protein
VTTIDTNKPKTGCQSFDLLFGQIQRGRDENFDSALTAVLIQVISKFLKIAPAGPLPDVQCLIIENIDRDRCFVPAQA